jgi:Fic family protein
MEYLPQYEITPNIITQIEKISRMQGELDTLTNSVSNEQHAYTLASIDAVHFSTKLEGNTLSIEQVTQALDGKGQRIKNSRDLKEVINYAKARSFLFAKSGSNEEFSVKSILSIHHLLMDNIVEGNLKGSFRESQNVIRDTSTRGITYLPPESKDVPVLIKSLLSWVKKSELEQQSALFIAPIFHYYFVTIHPFMDGNGRTARLLTNYILHKNNYEISKYAAIEKQHEKNRKDYYLALRKLQGNIFYDIPKQINLSSWIDYWLTCLCRTYKEALQRLTLEPDTNFSLNERLNKAVSLFKKHKRLKAAEYAILMGLERTQSVADLNKLSEEGIVSRVGKGKSTFYKLS